MLQSPDENGSVCPGVFGSEQQMRARAKAQLQSERIGIDPIVCAPPDLEALQYRANEITLNRKLSV